jgi:hypothetical protein
MADNLAECEYGERKPLKIEQDPMRGTVTIENTIFSRELLMRMGQGTDGIGETIRIEKKARASVECRRIKRCPKCGFDLDGAVFD